MMIHIKREVKLALTAIIAVIILIWGISFLKAKALFDNNDITVDTVSARSTISNLSANASIRYWWNSLSGKT